MDPQARAIIHRLEDALQVVLLLTDRLERDLQGLANQATQIREPLSKVVEAVRELQYVEHLVCPASDARPCDRDPKAFPCDDEQAATEQQYR